MSKQKAYFPKADVMMYVCQLKNPADNSTWVDVPAVKKMLDSRLGKTILDYAYIIHDRDTVTQDDVDSRDAQRTAYMARIYHDEIGHAMTQQDVQNFSVSDAVDAEALRKARAAVDARLPRFTLGAPKPAHIHITMILNQNRRVDDVATWFTDVAQPIPALLHPYKDNIKKSGDRKKNALLYLVHKNAPGKAQYRPDEITASFDYQAQLEKILELAAVHAKYQVTPDEVNDFINLIAEGKYTVRDFIDRYTYAIYARNQKNLDAAEKERITLHSVTPDYRMVGYFDSSMDERARIGKTTGCYVIALEIAKKVYNAPSDVFTDIGSVKSPNPYVFTVSVQTLFNGYAGQPILVFDDFRAGDLKRAFKCRAAVKNFWDPHPGSQRFDVKHNTVLPVAKYILISGIDLFRTFIHELSSIKASADEKDEDLATQFFGRVWWRCTFIDHTRYVVYKNQEFYPADISMRPRFYETSPYYCSVPAVMRAALPIERKMEILLRGFAPLYEHVMSPVSSATLSNDLEDFYALYGTPADTPYDGYTMSMATYDDTRDMSYPEIEDSIYYSNVHVSVDECAYIYELASLCHAEYLERIREQYPEDPCVRIERLKKNYISSKKRQLLHLATGFADELVASGIDVDELPFPDDEK